MKLNFLINIFLLILLSQNLLADKVKKNLIPKDSLLITIQIDSSAHKEVKIKESSLSKYRADNEFTYGFTTPDKGDSISDYIEYYINKVIYKLFKYSYNNIIVAFLYVFIILLVIYLIVSNSGSEFGRIFNRQGYMIKNTNVKIGEDERDINYVELISQLYNSNKFNEAVRYYHKYLLITLDEQKHLSYSEQKSNLDYRYEIKNPDLRKDYGVLTRVFENVYYGDYDIASDSFHKIKGQFDELIQRVKLKK